MGICESFAPSDCPTDDSRPFRTSVKRIVITSSVAAVRTDLPEPKLFTANDWNEQCLRAVKKDGKAASGPLKYDASKTLAEKGMKSVGFGESVRIAGHVLFPVLAAWRFYEEHQGSVEWDIVVFNPPWVFGVSVILSS
jgi:hypothetical protein